LIHSFILPSLLTEGEHPPFTIFARRIVHYLHNAFVLRDPGDVDHLPSFSTMDGVQDLFSLFVITIFLNVLDDRTYQFPPGMLEENPQYLQRCHIIFDLNVIPLIERHHLCYTRGLVFSLIRWFFDNYKISRIDSDLECETNPYLAILVPYTAHIGRQIVRYKRISVECGYTDTPTLERVDLQVRYALFGFDSMKDAYLDEKAKEEEMGYFSDDMDPITNPDELYDFNFDITHYRVDAREADEENVVQSSNYLDAGKTLTDRLFFHGLSCQFNLDKDGMFLFQYISVSLKFLVTKFVLYN
jgi:hypothetical protein